MAAKKPKKPLKKGGAKKKAASKPTKEETVDVSAGVQLLLGNTPPTRDLMYHYETILGLMDKARTAAAKVGDAKKKAKEAGIDVNDLMNMMKMARMDPLDLATELKQQAIMMRELGLPVQLSLYEPKYGSIEKQAMALGFAAGRAGRSPNVEMFPEGTPGHVEYMRGWNDGQAELIKHGKLKDNPDEDAGEEKQDD